jgi:hypothetical protein
MIILIIFLIACITITYAEKGAVSAIFFTLAFVISLFVAFYVASYTKGKRDARIKECDIRVKNAIERLGNANKAKFEQLTDQEDEQILLLASEAEIDKERLADVHDYTYTPKKTSVGSTASTMLKTAPAVQPREKSEKS